MINTNPCTNKIREIIILEFSVVIFFGGVAYVVFGLYQLYYHLDIHEIRSRYLRLQVKIKGTADNKISTII